MEFVDTNVLLSAYDASADDRHRRARELMQRLGRHRQGALSVQVLQEFYVNAVSKVAVPLTPEMARRPIRTLSRWPTHAPLATDVIAATTISEDHQISFWDAMIVRSAAALGCDILWTRRRAGGQSLRRRLRRPGLNSSRVPRTCGRTDLRHDPPHHARDPSGSAARQRR